jgi:Zn-dependent protease
MFSIPVRVHPSFWLVFTFFGWDYFIAFGFGYLALWIGVAFFSTLVHELGHVTAGIIFGSRGYIVLYGFGGVAIGSNDLRNRWQRVAVLFAGPVAQLLLAGLVYLVLRWAATPEWPEVVFHGLAMLLFFSTFWALFNLVPIWPLDGGQISREVLVWFSPNQGKVISLGISGCLAGLLAIHSLMGMNGRPLIPYVPTFSFFGVIFFGALCVSSFQELQAESERRRWDSDDDLPW